MISESFNYFVSILTAEHQGFITFPYTTCSCLAYVWDLHKPIFNASAFRRRRHYVLGCPSVRLSETWNTLFWPVHGSVGPPNQPWPFYGMSVRPSILVWHICASALSGWVLYRQVELTKLTRPDLHHVVGLFILRGVHPSVRPSVRRGFWAFAGERMEGMAWNFTCWCILTISKSD